MNETPEAAREGGVLELVGLSRRFGEVVALNGLSFSVPPSRVFGFLGPNGAGKTTTMRAVLGLLALDSGQVRWKGAPVDADARRRFGYMPEERGLYLGMEVAEHLEYLGRLHGLGPGAAAAAASQWTERLGLAGQRRAKIEALSHGNRQRAQLAATLVHGPELLVLDEPFAGLDPVAVDTMRDVLAQQAEAGVTVLFSSHQLDLVEDICEAVAIIDHGQLVAEGTVEELGRQGKPRLSVRVAGDRAGRWATRIAPLAKTESIKNGTVLLTLAPGSDSQIVLEAAKAAGVVEHFSVERRKLSEVFREALASGTASASGSASGHPNGQSLPEPSLPDQSPADDD